MIIVGNICIKTLARQTKFDALVLYSYNVCIVKQYLKIFSARHNDCYNYYMPTIVIFTTHKTSSCLKYLFAGIVIEVWTSLASLRPGQRFVRARRSCANTVHRRSATLRHSVTCTKLNLLP